MNEQLFKPIGGLLLATILLFTFSCKKVQKIENELSPDALSSRNNSECTFIFEGRVLDAKTLKPIEGAEIYIPEFDQFDLSSTNGEFSIGLEFPAVFDTTRGTVIKVMKKDYVLSTIEIKFWEFYHPDQCDDIIRERMDLDFALTKRNPMEILNPFWEAKEYSDTFRSIISDTVLCITDFIIDVPEYSVDNDVDFTFTPLDMNSYLGYANNDLNLLNGEECVVLRFECTSGQPQFNHPLELAFVPGRTIKDGDQLRHYVLDEMTNRWVLDSDADIKYIDGKIKLKIKDCSFHLITLFPCLELEDLVETNDRRICQTFDNIAVSKKQKNCDCGEPKVERVQCFFYGSSNGIYDEDLTLIGKYDEKFVRVLLNDLRHLLNAPALTKEHQQTIEYTTGNHTRLTIYEDREEYLEGLVGKCEIGDFKITQKFYRYKGEIKGRRFTYKIAKTVEVAADYTSCPIITKCHQGCPE